MQRLRVLNTSPIQVKNPCITLQLALCIYGSISEHATNHPSCSTAVYTYCKKSTYKWTHAVQTEVVQGLTVFYLFTDLLSHVSIIIERGVLRSPTIIVELSIFPSILSIFVWYAWGLYC